MRQNTLKNLLKAILRPTGSVSLRMLLVLLPLLLASCSEFQRPKVEPFYAETVPPPKQELRWANGKMPKNLDPARAAAAPETDIIRATYEGLTDLDSKSLKEIAGVAERWESSPDLRTWTFFLRKDARWSTGERVTAKDFVRSWKRLADLGPKAANSFLFQNIIGMTGDKSVELAPAGTSDFPGSSSSEAAPPAENPQTENNAPQETQPVAPPEFAPVKQDEDTAAKTETKRKDVAARKFGAEAINDFTLKISLDLPDKDFPKLISNPVFRPVYGDGKNFERDRLDAAVVTNGAFRITKVGENEITLERSDSYWNRKTVALEQVRFVASINAEAALQAYKRGDVDVVTNAAFEPLALKLLTPYEDFRRTTHNALNFYEFNTAKPPFSDRRVREALAIAIDRSKLTDGDLEGTTQPANRFLPLSEQKSETLSFDAEKAKQLLEKAGFPNGGGFAPIQLVINRNDAQQRIARSVARMWKHNLNLDTVVVVKETSEIDAVKRSGEFDVLRRGVVLPTNDEMVNLSSILGSAKKIIEKPSVETMTIDDTEKDRSFPVAEDVTGGPLVLSEVETLKEDTTAILMLTEADVIFELRAIPLYFPVSYSLVKPYIRGFEMNGLDAPSLKEISIDNNWQPKTARGE